MPGILIVDDHPGIRLLLRRFIEAETPFTVCGDAANGREAIERVQELHPNLILLDFSMPVMSGAEAANILKKSFPEIKIVLFSMHGDSVLKAIAATIGVDAVVPKPKGIAKLPSLLNTLLARTGQRAQSTAARADAQRA